MPSNSIVVDLELSKNKISGEGAIDSVPGSLVPKPGNAVDVDLELSKNTVNSLSAIPPIAGSLIGKPTNNIQIEFTLEVFTDPTAIVSNVLPIQKPQKSPNVLPNIL